MSRFPGPCLLAVLVVQAAWAQTTDPFDYFNDGEFYYLTWKEGRGPEDERAVLMEWDRPEDGRLELEVTVVANSCAPPQEPQARCTLSLNLWERNLAYIWDRGPKRGQVAKEFLGRFTGNRPDHFYWKAQGFDYPVVESREDTFTCSPNLNLPLGLVGPDLHIPLWTLQHELQTREYLSNGSTTRLALAARGVHLKRVGDGAFRLEDIASLGLPWASDSNNTIWAFYRAQAMEWVFFPGDTSGPCRISFAVEESHEIYPRKRGDRPTLESAHPLRVNPRDYHQYFYHDYFNKGNP